MCVIYCTLFKRVGYNEEIVKKFMSNNIGLEKNKLHIVTLKHQKENNNR